MDVGIRWKNAPAQPHSPHPCGAWQCRSGIVVWCAEKAGMRGLKINPSPQASPLCPVGTRGEGVCKFNIEITS
jgi:hypothetical protein